jgi:hypothetical protein
MRNALRNGSAGTARTPPSLPSRKVQRATERNVAVIESRTGSDEGLD